VWLINCRRADLDEFFKRQPTYLYDNCRLCSNHFEDSQFVNPATRNQLKSCAIPTIFDVPNPPLRLASARRSPKIRISSANAKCSEDRSVVDSGDSQGCVSG
jgi:THAP domain